MGEDQKKKPSAQNLRLSLRVHTCFSSWKEILLTLFGAQAVLWGVQAAKCNSVAPGLLLSFGAQPSLRGHNSCLGGTSSDLGGTVRNAPRGARPDTKKSQ